MIGNTRNISIIDNLRLMGPGLVLGLVLGLSAPTALAGDPAGDEAEPDASAQIAQLKATCRDAAAEIEQRQAESSLYERLGGREKINALTDEIVRLHRENDRIKNIFEGVDTDRLSGQVAEFMVAGYGGDGEYTGRDMTEAHAHLGITDAHFLTAGGDIGKALGNLGYGEEVTQEVICSLMPFHEQVVSR